MQNALGLNPGRASIVHLLPKVSRNVALLKYTQVFWAKTLKTFHILPLRVAVGCASDCKTFSHGFEGIKGPRCLIEQETSQIA